MDDEKLIFLVRNKECLFNLTHKDYTDIGLKMRIWKEIGDEMGLSGAECKYRWFSLRDQYRRSVRSSKRTLSGQNRKWRYDHAMSFLLPHLQERDTWSNVSEEIESEDPRILDGDEVVNPPKEDHYTLQRHLDPLFIEPELNSSSSRDENVIATFKPPSLSRSKKSKTKQTGETPTTASISKHPMDAFLYGVGQTIKTFPPIYQHMAKLKIFNIVSDIEMQLLMAPQTPIGTPFIQISTDDRFLSQKTFTQEIPMADCSQDNYVKVTVPCTPVIYESSQSPSSCGSQSS
ncbi:uncharacterized protein LOC143349831 isoform X1 [Colletes latitarsis]|uniref:uncharacterized protein LOC143349831 isoform X1 n=2 Tax=Colletes latitarsis TaxID=2605962 RepID=UPI004035DAF1